MAMHHGPIVFSLYFQGERGLTQTFVLPISGFQDDTYESTVNVLDVGNVIHERDGSTRIRALPPPV